MSLSARPGKTGGRAAIAAGGVLAAVVVFGWLAFEWRCVYEGRTVPPLPPARPPAALPATAVQGFSEDRAGGTGRVAAAAGTAEATGDRVRGDRGASASVTDTAATASLTERLARLLAEARALHRHEARWKRIRSAGAWISGPADVRETLRFLEGLPVSSDRTALAVGIAERWALQDPEAAASWALGYRSDAAVTQKLGTDPLSAALKAWVENDADGAAVWLATIPEGLRARQREAATTVFTKWAESDPRQAATWASTSSFDAALRTHALREVVRVWARSDPDAAWSFLEGLPGGLFTEDMKAVLVGRLARLDLTRAVTMADRIGRGGSQEMAWRQIAAEWALRDFAAAQRFYASLPVARPHVGAPGDPLVFTAEPDPAFRERDFCQRIVGEAAGLRAPEDPRAAFLWFREHETGVPDADGVKRSLVEAWGRKAPREAAEWMLDAQNRQPTDLIKVAIERWARADYAAAISCVANLPEGALDGTVRAFAYEMTIREVARRDGARAASMADRSSFAVSPVVIAEIAWNWAEQDPEAAAAWATALPAGAERDRAISDVARQWALYDPRAAQQWQVSLPHAVPR